MTTCFLAEVDRYSTDGLTMKPKETFLFLFRFICGSFLNRKQQNMNVFWCGRLKWSWICPRWPFVHDTFTCLQNGVETSRQKWKRAFSRILNELHLSPLANTRFRRSRVIWNRESALSRFTQAWCHAIHPRNKSVRAYYLQGHHANWQ